MRTVSWNRSLFAAVLVATIACTVVVTAPAADAVDLSRLDFELDDVATSSIHVDRVRHVDLDDDGRNETLVALSFDTAGGPRWMLQVHRATASGAELVGSTYNYHEQWQELDRLVAGNGAVEFSLLQGEDRAWMQVERWEYADGEFRFGDSTPGGRVVRLGAGSDGHNLADRLTINRSGTTYLDVAPGGDTLGVMVETDASTSLRMRSDHHSAQLRIYDMATGHLADVARVDSFTALRPDASYLLVPVTSADRVVRVEVSVGEERALRAPEIVRRSVAEGHDDEPRRSISMHWFELASAPEPVDLDLVNGHIRSFVEAIRSEHEAAAAECPEGTAATLYVDGYPELVSYDLVSFSFNIQSCLCERDDRIVARSLTVDLASGRVLDADDIAPDAGQLEAAWWQQLEATQAWHIEDLELEVGGPVEITAVNLSPYGSVIVGEIVVDETTPPHQMAVYLPFEEAQGVLDPDLIVRAESGRDVQLPTRGCGC